MSDTEKRIKHLENIIIGDLDAGTRREQILELRHLQRRKLFYPELFDKKDRDRLAKAEEDVKKHPKD